MAISMFPSLAGRSADDRSRLSTDPSFGHAPEDPTGRAYTADAFEYFFTLERKRAERSGRSFLLLLIDLDAPETTAGEGGPLDPTVAPSVFVALGPLVRDTDFVGWHRLGHVIGAVLTHPTLAPGVDVSHVVAERIGAALRRGVPATLAGRLRLRVYPVTGAAPEARALWG